MEEIFENVFKHKGEIFTKNLSPGKRVYGEKLLIINGIEYRRWDPFRSKLCGAIMKGLNQMPIKRGSSVLYLGASTGTTVSHVSDIVEKEGTVFAVEVSPKMINELIENVAKYRENVVPILANARVPKEYAEIGMVDVIYQDVAQPDQAEILIKNADMFLREGGFAMMCVKSQSIDVTVNAKETYKKVEQTLSKTFDILEKIELSPYDKEHEFVVMKKKSK